MSEAASGSAAVACSRCGTFLPAGVTGLCEACARREANDRERLRAARLMALCLAWAGLMMAAPGLYAVFRKPADAPQMLAVVVQAGGPLWVGAWLVLWRRSATPGWVGIGISLLCPFSWLLTLGRFANWKSQTLMAAAVCADLLAIAVGIRLRRLSRQAQR